MKRFFAISAILILLSAFSIFIYCRQLSSTVLKVIEPGIVQIDLNNNGIADDNETICIPDIESFSLNLTDKAPPFAENLNLKTTDIISMGYLADEFANNLLSAKSVKVKLNGNKTPDCRYGEIITDEEKYSDKLLESGFAARKGIYSKERLNEKLTQARKLKLVILNRKSNKYHKLDCEYGLISSDYTIIPEKQLPKEAQACKVCHLPKFSETKKQLKLKTNIKKPKEVITDGNIKLILSDFTQHLKPNRKCETESCLAILNEINNTTESIDLAVYGMDKIPALYEALVKAKERNVKIRVVYDKSFDSSKEYYKETSAIVKLADEAKSDYAKDKVSYTNQLMHNKFLIFDNKTVLTGSMNISNTGTSDYNANSVVIIKSKEVAELFTAEFEQMLSGKFHNLKTNSGLPNNFVSGNTKLQVYFSPYDKPMQYIIPLIDSAKNYVYVPAFLVTHTALTEALIRAKKRNVDVKIIIDANSTSTRNSKHYLLRQNLVQLKTENYAGKMHSKSIIIDDKFVVTSSMNFSNSGENKNDENVLIIENTAIAKLYRSYFLYLWSLIPDIYLTKNARAESKESIGSCSDNVDNDFDGLFDMADPGCK